MDKNCLKSLLMKKAKGFFYKEVICEYERKNNNVIGNENNLSIDDSFRSENSAVKNISKKSLQKSVSQTANLKNYGVQCACPTPQSFPLSQNEGGGSPELSYCNSNNFDSRTSNDTIVEDNNMLELENISERNFIPRKRGRPFGSNNEDKQKFVVVKKKVSTHYVPPDMLAIKMLLESFGSEVDENDPTNLSDEELEAQIITLIDEFNEDRLKRNSNIIE